MLLVADGVLLNEQQLEPDDEAVYQFSATNQCNCVGLRNIRITFEADVMDGGGVSFAPNPFIFETTLGPGGSFAGTVTIITANATPGPRRIRAFATYEPVLLAQGNTSDLSVTVSPD